ncbi:response regulator transcription factor [Pararobbsia silviterrae]|uniref:DNA-binding response regulator n=1 Tax=Pararobbsia silviterrae TaxID=1792498 RepID=A0A494WYZ6_9BURK|nr:response regulator transcription factor [Pararobbsia silviterrae]RKP43758.1 DNA-binding response regulator [Pararobbsia silviterrae]
MATLLVVESDPTFGAPLAHALTRHGHRVTWQQDGIEGRAMALSGTHELIAIGRLNPGLDSLDMLDAIRAAALQTPVALLGDDDLERRIRALRAGADDYVVKPFHTDEVIARFEVVLRRRPDAAFALRETTLRVGPLELDLLNRTIRCENRMEPLQPTEFRLMEYMMRHAGQTLTRTRLFEAVWGYHFNPGTNIVDVHVGQLRKKIKGLVAHPLLKTIRGSGYAFG